MTYTLNREEWSATVLEMRRGWQSDGEMVGLDIQLCYAGSNVMDYLIKGAFDPQKFMDKSQAMIAEISAHRDLASHADDGAELMQATARLYQHLWDGGTVDSWCKEEQLEIRCSPKLQM